MTSDRADSAFAGVFSSFLADLSDFSGSPKDTLREICVSLISAMQGGDTCIRLTGSQEELLSCCSLVSATGDKPLVVSRDRLYLARYYNYEKQLAEKLAGLAAVTHCIDNLDGLLSSCFSSSADTGDQQREAARVALTRGLCIVSGGPGTGKTTTVVKMVALLLAYYGPGHRIVLTAPTGKAAMRLQESVAGQISSLAVDDTIKNAMPRDARTLHRLLGVQQQSPSFKHNKKRKLPWDVVIVDEASMVDLALMSKLTDALAGGTRLILLGDKDQLSSVESGAVLADCIRTLAGNVVELTVAHRFNAQISALAGYINNGDGYSAVRMIENEQDSAVAKAGPRWLDVCGDKYEDYLATVKVFSGPGDLSALFQSFNRFRILCALKSGALGVAGVNGAIERILAARGCDCGKYVWYPGRPVIITRNDYSLGLYNGDIGICLHEPSGNGEWYIWFEREDGSFQRFPPSRLPSHETAWAMTVHKSQGSEFNEVVVVLPEKDNQVLSRELLYTAVTRARDKVIIRADASLCKQVIEGVTDRQSGLGDQLQYVFIENRR